MPMENETIAQSFIIALDHFKIGQTVNTVILAFGGIVNISLIYYILMVYYQAKINNNLKKQQKKLDKILKLLEE